MAGLFPLVIGLGNPGSAYRGTRHNIGFAVLDHWAARHGGVWKQARFANAEASRLPDGTWLVKPLSYMNCSGPEVARCLKWFQRTPEDLIVVVDDVNLPTGRLRLRPSGSDGGHNGLRSIQAALGTMNYARLRCGVGAARSGQDLKDHVLQPFKNEEIEIVETMIDQAARALEDCQSLGLDPVMTTINRTP